MDSLTIKRKLEEIVDLVEPGSLKTWKAAQVKQLSREFNLFINDLWAAAPCDHNAPRYRTDWGERCDTCGRLIEETDAKTATATAKTSS